MTRRAIDAERLRLELHPLLEDPDRDPAALDALAAEHLLGWQRRAFPDVPDAPDLPAGGEGWEEPPERAMTPRRLGPGKRWWTARIEFAWELVELLGREEALVSFELRRGVVRPALWWAAFRPVDRSETAAVPDPAAAGVRSFRPEVAITAAALRLAVADPVLVAVLVADGLTRRSAGASSPASAPGGLNPLSLLHDAWFLHLQSPEAAAALARGFAATPHEMGRAVMEAKHRPGARPLPLPGLETPPAPSPRTASPSSGGSLRGPGSAPAPTDAEAQAVARMPAVRQRLLETVSVWTAEEVADRLRTSAAAVRRARDEGRLLAVDVDGQARFPSFQFTTDRSHGRIRPGVSQVLAALDAVPIASDWARLDLLTAPNAAEDDRRSVAELLCDGDTEQALAAVQRYGETGA